MANQNTDSNKNKKLPGESEATYQARLAKLKSNELPDKDNSDPDHSNPAGHGSTPDKSHGRS